MLPGLCYLAIFYTIQKAPHSLYSQPIIRAGCKNSHQIKLICVTELEMSYYFHYSHHDFQREKSCLYTQTL